MMAQQKTQEESKSRKNVNEKEETAAAKTSGEKGDGAGQGEKAGSREMQRTESRAGEGRATEISRRREEGRGMVRRQAFPRGWESPLRMMRQISDEMDRVIEDLGLSWPLRGLTGGDLLSRGGATMWMPPVEVLQQGDKLLVRADLPGLQKDDVRVEVQSGALTIEGERKQEFEETEEGVYRSERVYGRFSRSIPLPEGADADQAKATFRNGVLEVELPVAAQAEQGRRLEIQST